MTTPTISKLHLAPRVQPDDSWTSHVRIDHALGAVAVGIAVPVVLVQSWPSQPGAWLMLLAASIALLGRRSTARTVWIGATALAFSVSPGSALLAALVVLVAALAAGRLRRTAIERDLVDFVALMSALLVGVTVAGPLASRSMLSVIAGALAVGHIYAGGWLLAEKCCAVSRDPHRWRVPDARRELLEAGFAAVVAGAMGHLLVVAANPPDESVWPAMGWIIVPAALAGLVVTVAAAVTRSAVDRVRSDALDARLRQTELSSLPERGRCERVATLALGVARRLGLKPGDCTRIVESIVWQQPAADTGARSVRIIGIVAAYDRMTVVRPGWPVRSPEAAIATLQLNDERPAATEIIDALSQLVAEDAAGRPARVAGFAELEVADA